jgi:hypothetical protein
VEPQDFEFGEFGEVPNLPQILNIILPQVKLLRQMGYYLQPAQMGELLEAADPVHRERHDFEVGHFAEELQVLRGRLRTSRSLPQRFRFFMLWRLSDFVFETTRSAVSAFPRDIWIKLNIFI